MLFRNLLLIAFFIGMALSIPVDEKGDKTSDVQTTITLVALETVPATKDAENNDTEVIQMLDYVEYTPKENDAVEEKKEEEKKEDVAEEEKKEDVAEEEKKVDEKKEEVVAEEKENKVEDIEEINAKIGEEFAPSNIPPFIPENDDILTEFEDTCTKDHLILGNHVTTDVCDEIYNSCTSKELFSVIVYFYSKDAPVSIEYTINEGMNKGTITEKCANALIDTKIFIKDTVVLQPVGEQQPVTHVTDLYQDMPTQDPNARYVVEDELPTLGDIFAEFSEDDIDENEN